MLRSHMTKTRPRGPPKISPNSRRSSKPNSPRPFQKTLAGQTGTTSIHDIKPGTLYAMNRHDHHRIRAKTRMRIVCTFSPALTGTEVHDADGSL